MNTFTLEPSFNGLTTTGNFNLLFIILTSCGFFLSNEYVKNFGVLILYFVNNFLDISLSIANADGITPECVYGILNVSSIV